MSRPSKYTKELSDKLCAKLSDGISLRKICEEKQFPSKTNIFKWLRTNQEFRDQYAIAKKESADAHSDDIIDIVDNEALQPVIFEGEVVIVNGKPLLAANAVTVAHARLRMDARKWLSSKLNPKKYGDRIQAEHTSPDGSMSPPKRIILEAASDNQED